MACTCTLRTNQEMIRYLPRKEINVVSEAYY